jgi:hypothetical protein
MAGAPAGPALDPERPADRLDAVRETDESRPVRRARRAQPPAGSARPPGASPPRPGCSPETLGSNLRATAVARTHEPAHAACDTSSEPSLVMRTDRRQPLSELDQIPDRLDRRGGRERLLQRPDAGDVGVFAGDACSGVTLVSPRRGASRTVSCSTRSRPRRGASRTATTGSRRRAAPGVLPHQPAAAPTGLRRWRGP